MGGCVEGSRRQELLAEWAAQDLGCIVSLLEGTWRRGEQARTGAAPSLKDCMHAQRVQPNGRRKKHQEKHTQTRKRSSILSLFPSCALTDNVCHCASCEEVLTGPSSAITEQVERVNLKLRGSALLSAKNCQMRIILSVYLEFNSPPSVIAIL